MARWAVAGYSFRYARFRWVYASNMAFFFAMNAQFVVRGILAFRLTGSALALGLINLAVAVPMLIISPFGGVVADRMDRRRLIVLGQAMLLANEVVVFGLLVAGVLEFWMLFVSVGVMGCGFPIVMPARQAVVVTIVGRDGLANAIALQSGGMNAARVVGPVMGGSLVAFSGLRGAYLVSIGLYCLALLAISRIGPAPVERSGERASVFSDMREGFSFAWDHRLLRMLLIAGIIPSLLAMPFQSLLVIFAEEVWNVGSNGLGALQATAGLGGVVGSLVMAVVGEGRRPLLMMVSTGLAFAAALLLFALSPFFLLALPMVLAANLFAALFQTANSTAVQALIPDEVRGRVMSIMMMTFGFTPLGSVPVAAAAEVWGAPVAIAGAAIATGLLTAAVFAFSPSLRLVDRALAAQREEGTESIPRRRAGAGVAPVP